METAEVYWGYMGDNGKEKGNYYNSILGLYWGKWKMETAIVY